MVSKVFILVALDMRPDLDLGVNLATSSASSLVSFSSSSISVGRGVPPAMARADSTSSGLTDVCRLPLLMGVEGVFLGVTPVIKPPSGAESSSAGVPDKRRDLLTGVSGSAEPTSLDDILLLLRGVLLVVSSISADPESLDDSLPGNFGL